MSMPVDMKRRWCGAVVTALFFLGLLPRTGWSADGLTVFARPAGAAVQVVLNAPLPFRFALRHLASPPRLVVDLLGLGAMRVPGALEVNVAPVRAIHIARTSGLLQAVVYVTEPVLAGVSQTADARSLTLTLRPQPVALGRPVPGPVLPTEVGFKHSSRIRPLKLSTTAFWAGLPASMKTSSTPCV
jgi:hypothetical protein